MIVVALTHLHCWFSGLCTTLSASGSWIPDYELSRSSQYSSIFLKYSIVYSLHAWLWWDKLNCSNMRDYAEIKRIDKNKCLGHQPVRVHPGYANRVRTEIFRWSKCDSTHLFLLSKWNQLVRISWLSNWTHRHQMYFGGIYLVYEWVPIRLTHSTLIVELWYLGGHFFRTFKSASEW